MWKQAALAVIIPPVQPGPKRFFLICLWCNPQSFSLGWSFAASNMRLHRSELVGIFFVVWLSIRYSSARQTLSGEKKEEFHTENMSQSVWGLILACVNKPHLYFLTQKTGCGFCHPISSIESTLGRNLWITCDRLLKMLCFSEFKVDIFILNVSLWSK